MRKQTPSKSLRERRLAEALKRNIRRRKAAQKPDQKPDKKS